MFITGKPNTTYLIAKSSFLDQSLLASIKAGRQLEYSKKAIHKLAIIMHNNNDGRQAGAQEALANNLNI